MLELRNVNFSYANKKILENINLHLKSGEILSLLGPSGAGKSTLLHLISGLQVADSGKVIHNHQDVTGPSHSRVIIFQDHQLFPWQNVRQNIQFALKAQNKDSGEYSRFLNLVEMQKYADHFPHELSGGMKQRVGIARALAADPDVLLLDEAFASLDPLIRFEIMNEVMTIVKQLNKTVIMVTHNIEEALFFSDRICLMAGNPACLQDEIKVELTRSHDLFEARGDAKFIQYEKQIYRKFLELRSDK